MFNFIGQISRGKNYNIDKEHFQNNILAKSKKKFFTTSYLFRKLGAELVFGKIKLYNNVRKKFFTGFNFQK